MGDRRREQTYRPCEDKVGVARAETRKTASVDVLAKDDGGRAGGGEELFVLPIGEKGDIPGSGILNPGHTVDLDVTVTVETTRETGGEVAELHGDQIVQFAARFVWPQVAMRSSR